MKANHNPPVLFQVPEETVSYGSKILKWKQITTADTGIDEISELFPMVQRY